MAGEASHDRSRGRRNADFARMRHPNRSNGPTGSSGASGSAGDAEAAAQVRWVMMMT